MTGGIVRRCVVCGRVFRSYNGLMWHAYNHVDELVELGVVKIEVMKLGGSRLELYAYKGKHYLSPTDLLHAVYEEQPEVIAAITKVKRRG
jgi:hypothetical protein